MPMSIARIHTVAYDGINTVDVEAQVQISNGLPAFTIVGLPDKAVAESRERVRAALHSLGLSLPPKRLTVNLAPADLAKEGAHFDLPIALGVMCAMNVLSSEDLLDATVLGELGLDGSLRSVIGILPAAIHAKSRDNCLICPSAGRAEASWAGDIEIIAPADLLQLINHFKGTQLLPTSSAELPIPDQGPAPPDIQLIKGQESAKRALEIAAAGGHNLLMVGPPGAGKSMLAHAFPGLLPPLSAAEALEVSMIHSLSGTLPEGGLLTSRPFRDPHHSASLPALTGGGHKIRPGEISLAHRGVLFLDELPEFSRQALEALRQPLETGKILIARANRHIRYPAAFQLIAAMNPCRCGYYGDEERSCSQAPICARNYQAKISGPMFDRFDMRIDIPPVSYSDLSLPAEGDTSEQIRRRVVAARALQNERHATLTRNSAEPPCNAALNGAEAEAILTPSAAARDLLGRVTEKLRLSARGYYRLLKVARTIGDLEGAEGEIDKNHIAQALSYRQLA